jgi:glycolate oxidase FAD binding subunit
MPLTRFGEGDAREVEVVSTARMNKVVEHAVGDMTVVVQAGISLEALQRALAWQNQWLPVDPPVIGARMPGQRTIGGMIATNSLGPLRLAGGGGGGDWRLLVLGMKWVDAEGRVIKGGGQTVKNVAGYSSPRMLVGTCGTLGIIGEVTLRTFARPADERCVLFFCESEAAGEELLAAVTLSPTTPAYVQVIGGRTFAGNPLQLPAPDAREGSVVVVVGFLGRAEACAAQLEVVRGLSAAGGLESIAQTAAQAGRLRQWMTIEPEIAEGEVGVRMHVRPSKVAEMVARLERGRRGWVVSEAGTGVVRAVVEAGDGVKALAGAADLTVVTQGRLPEGMGAEMVEEGAARLKRVLDERGAFGGLPAMVAGSWGIH